METLVLICFASEESKIIFEIPSIRRNHVPRNYRISLRLCLRVEILSNFLATRFPLKSLDLQIKNKVFQSRKIYIFVDLEQNEVRERSCTKLLEKIRQSANSATAKRMWITRFL